MFHLYSSLMALFLLSSDMVAVQNEACSTSKILGQVLPRNQENTELGGEKVTGPLSYAVICGAPTEGQGDPFFPVGRPNIQRVPHDCPPPLESPVWPPARNA